MVQLQLARHMNKTNVLLVCGTYYSKSLQNTTYSNFAHVFNIDICLLYMYLVFGPIKCIEEYTHIQIYDQY